MNCAVKNVIINKIKCVTLINKSKKKQTKKNGFLNIKILSLD